ncbi:MULTISPECIES: hypothetical protein [unclassified Pseudomonas]|uniref:hypothetical protein n=1 Tax=unclassified Pseudomonas TaxID=196821 RepID=UPI000A1D62C1|nr:MULTISPECIES: hypothetical protein [unclassified Pseudomonas]
MDYSTSELLAWLGKETRLLGWDMLCFIDGDKINLVLKEESIRRSRTAEKWPPISGYIRNGAAHRFALSKCSLNLPRLVFDADLAQNKAHLQMAIAEANAYSMVNKGGQWRLLQLNVIAPVQAAVLNLDIALAASGGTVDSDCMIKLDLSNSEEFSMPYYNGESRLLTEFFRQKFSAWGDAQRQLPLGKLAGSAIELHRPASFALRTRARARSSSDAAGGVMVLVDMQDGAGGNYPGADYRYAIPNDGDYSASILFDTERLMLAQVAEQLKKVIEGAEFTMRQALDQRQFLSCTTGHIHLPTQRVKETFDITTPSRVWKVNAELELKEASLDMRGEVVISKTADKVTLSLSPHGSVFAEILAFDDTTGDLQRMLDEFKFDQSDFLKPAEGRFHYHMLFEYHLDGRAEMRLVHDSYAFSESIAYQPAFAKIKPPAGWGVDPITNLLLWPIISQLTSGLRDLFKGLASPKLTSIQDILLAKLKHDMSVLPTTQALANDIVRLNFDNAIKGTNLQTPSDTVYFGQVNPAAASFTISPMEKTLLATARQSFVTEPASSNVEWSAEAVSGLADNVRISIDPKGVLTAPAASDMTKSFAQVLVTATDKANRAIQRCALITVVSQTLHANPSIVVAPPNSKVDFNAWVLGDPLALQWQYQGKPLGKGQAMSVTSPADTGTAAFVVEEVQVQDPVSKQICECVLVTEMGSKTPIVISAKVDPTGREAVLEARINGNLQEPNQIDWQLRYGPGSAEAGVYTPGSDQKARFALISATYDSGAYGVFEGYIVLALPLAEHRDLTLN